MEDIVDMVRKKCGYVYVQLWHAGRVSVPALMGIQCLRLLLRCRRRSVHMPVLGVRICHRERCWWGVLSVRLGIIRGV